MYSSILFSILSISPLLCLSTSVTSDPSPPPFQQVKTGGFSIPAAQQPFGYFVTNPTHFYLFAVLPADSLPLDPTSRDAALAEAQLNSREQPDQSLQYPTSPISFEVNSASVHPFKYQGQLSYANMTDILAANNLAAYLKESTVTDSMEVDVYIFDQCVRASGGGAGVGDLECFYQGGVKFRLTETASTGSAGGSGNGTVSGNGNANTNGTVAAVQQPSSTP